MHGRRSSTLARAGGYLRAFLGNLEEILTASLLVALSVVMCASVFFRYAVDNPLGWSEPLSRFVLVWLAFMGAAVVIKRSEHLQLDATGFLGARAGAAVRMLSLVLQAAVLGLLLWQGMLLTLANDAPTSILWLSQRWVYAAVPVGAAFMLLALARNAVAAHRGH